MNPFIKKKLARLLKQASQMAQGSTEILTAFSNTMDFVRSGHLEFTPRFDDIFIVTYPGSGMAFLQMILYQLTTDGPLNFDHINQVSPWFEHLLANRLMEARDFDRFPAPRIFRSHLSYKMIPKSPACRYIHIRRDCGDVLVAYYHFYRSHLQYRGNFNDFFKRFMSGRVQYGSWFTHTTDWIQNPKKLKILHLDFEDVKAHPSSEIDRIEAFIDLSLTRERKKRVLEKANFQFMKQHATKFDYISGMDGEKGDPKNTDPSHGAGETQSDYLSPAQREALNAAMRRSRLGG